MRHSALVARKTPNRPFRKVNSQLNVPGPATDAVNLIAPVLMLTFGLPSRLKSLFGAGVRSGADANGDEVSAGVGVGIGEVEDDGVAGGANPGGDGDTAAAGATITVWRTGGAATYSPLPAWAASIVHTPGAMKLTVEPSSEHADGVADEYETGSPDEASADTA